VLSLFLIRIPFAASLLQQSAEESALSVLDESIAHVARETLTDVDILPKLSGRQIVLRRCGQQEPLLFDDVYSER